MRALVFLLLLCGCSALPSSRRGVVFEPVLLGPKVKAEVIRPAGTGPFPAVVVVHGDMGPTAGVRDNAIHLADAGFLTLVVDLYRGEKVTNVLDAHILDRALPEERVRGDLQAGVAYLRTRPDARAERVGIVGFDSGGGYSLDYALVDPRVAAVVVCYGRLTTDAALLAKLNASVLGIFAGDDAGIDEATRKSFVTAMDKAGKKVADMIVYEKCENGFLVVAPDRPEKAEATRVAVKAARERMVSYLKAELK